TKGQYPSRRLIRFASGKWLWLIAERVSPLTLNASSLVANVSPRTSSVAVNLSWKWYRLRARPISNASRYTNLTVVEGLKLAAQTFTKDVTQLSSCAG
ncbi:hypothetical protein ACUVNF_29295, partial [Pseudomonas sp. RSP]